MILVPTSLGSAITTAREDPVVILEHRQGPEPGPVGPGPRPGPGPGPRPGPRPGPGPRLGLWEHAAGQEPGLEQDMLIPELSS